MQRIIPPETGDLGSSVDLQGNRFAVGFPGASSGFGALQTYVHDGSQWTFEQKMTPRNTLAIDDFGANVALDGDRILGSAFSRGSSLEGAADAFRYDGTRWLEQAMLLASDGNSADFFGDALELQGDTAFVSSSRKEIGNDGQHHGVTYVYGLGDLTLSASDTDPAAGDRLDLWTCGGLSGGLRLLRVVEVAGASSSITLDLGPFDAFGERVTGGTVPSGLGGLTARFQSIGFTAPGRIGVSNDVVLTFQ